jgi:hypothetical protein
MFLIRYHIVLWSTVLSRLIYLQKLPKLWLYASCSVSFTKRYNLGQSHRQNSYSTVITFTTVISIYIHNIRFDHPSPRINNPSGIPRTTWSAFTRLIGRSTRPISWRKIPVSSYPTAKYHYHSGTTNNIHTICSRHKAYMKFVILAVNTLVSISITILTAIFIHIISSLMSGFNYIWTTFYN